MLTRTAYPVRAYAVHVAASDTSQNMLLAFTCIARLVAVDHCLAQSKLVLSAFLDDNLVLHSLIWNISTSSCRLPLQKQLFITA